MELIDNNGISKNIDGVSTIELGKEVPEDYYHCLMLPQSCNRKERTEAIGTLFSEMMSGTSLNKPEYNKDTTDAGIPIEFAHALRSIGRLVGYMVNCASWESGEMKDYDKIELIKRVQNIQFNK